MKIIKVESLPYQGEHYLVNNAIRFYPNSHRAWIIKEGINVEDYAQLEPYFTPEELTILRLRFGPLINTTKRLYDLFVEAIKNGI